MLFFSISVIFTFNWSIHGTHGRDSSTIRLVGGYHNESEGRVEVFHKGQWGTVCDTFWDREDADVACRQLGHKEAISNPLGAYFGEGSGKIWIDKIDCTGDEKNIFDCDIEYNNPLYCNDHSRDASVICRTTSYVQNALRQDMSTTALEILHDSEWGLMCTNGWDDNAGNVACHMLGFDFMYDLKHLRRPNEQRRWLRRVKCTGSERNIDECDHSSWGDYSCDEVVSVFCAGLYDGVACSGRVCDNSQHCCGGIDYDYCCDRSSPTTTSKMMTKLTSSNAPIAKEDSSLFWFVIIPVAIAILVIVVIWRKMCNRQGNNEGNSTIEERPVPNQVPERQPAHNPNFINPSSHPTIKAEAPPAYDTIDFQKTNNEGQSELSPPAYSAS